MREGCFAIASQHWWTVVHSVVSLPLAVEFIAAAVIALLAFTAGYGAAMLYDRERSTELLCLSGAVAAVAALIFSITLHAAAGKPALQALAAGIMLAVALVSTAVWQCSARCAAPAVVPLKLSGKLRA